MVRRVISLCCFFVLLISFSIPVFAEGSTLREYSMHFLGLDLTGDGNLNSAINDSSGKKEMIVGTDCYTNSFTCFGLAFAGPGALGECSIKVEYFICGPASDGEAFRVYGAYKSDGEWQFDDLGSVSNAGQTVTSGGYVGMLNTNVNLTKAYTRIYFYKYFNSAKKIRLGYADPTYTLSPATSTSNMAISGSSNINLPVHQFSGDTIQGTIAMASNSGTFTFTLPSGFIQRATSAITLSGKVNNTTYTGTATAGNRYSTAFSASAIISSDDGLLPYVQNIDSTTQNIKSDTASIKSTTTNIKSDTASIKSDTATIKSTTTHMDQTLNQVSENMQKVVDNMETENNTANDIAGTTTDQQINNRDGILANGVTSLDTLSESADVSSYKSAASGYIGLLAAVVPTFLNFGGNNLLTTVLVVMIIFSVFVFILRRLL